MTTICHNVTKWQFEQIVPAQCRGHIPHWVPPALRASFLKAALLYHKSWQLWEVAKCSESHLSFLLFVEM